MLVVAAEEIVVQEGSARLSVRKITRRIGYSPGTLYQHFAGIDDLLIQVNGRTLEKLAQALRSGDVMAASEVRLHNFARVYLAFVRQNERLWGALFQFARDEDQETPEWYRRKLDVLIDTVAGAFEGLGLSDHAERRAAAEMIWASVHAVCSLDASGKLPLLSGRSLERLIDDLVSVHISACRRKS